ncbi:Lrp/AsnC family transcriptional regulator [Klenkia brasiliensis]|uniref:DNA-binding transcriptional regulator, Lrp family n=1 Tax=Klenkia brasiliensis TaxID=333142 RepID=A0A1G7Y0N0_9ACTN|nr:Lrp/AsnC family transcriptional regulator [Klenkia brasiliensis]SDG90025.1 DNA-binding transcriptional regulator, Lrp family [Klenkia brasiliensis]
MSEGSRRTLDDVDRRLLELLRADGRRPNNQLAAAVGLSPSTCLARVRALVAEGVITRFTVELDPDAVGDPLQALVAVRLRPGARHQLNVFADGLRQLPEVAQFFYLAGAEDFVVHVRARDTAHLRDFVTDRISTQPMVAATNTSLIFEHERGR